MNRVIAVIVAAALVLSGAGAGLTLWLLTRNMGPHFPEISAYSHGEMTRVGPYFYCSLRDLNNCVAPQTVGVVRVVENEPVQLSVSGDIGASLWALRVIYEDPRDATETLMRPGTLAATIPSVDPVRGRLTGIAVQLPVPVITPTGEEDFLSHAEWSVATVWDDQG